MYITNDNAGDLRPPSPYSLFMYWYKKSYRDPFADDKTVGRQCGVTWASLYPVLKTPFVVKAIEKKIEYDLLVAKKENYRFALKYATDLKTQCEQDEKRFFNFDFKTSIESESSSEMSTSSSSSSVNSPLEMSLSPSEKSPSEMSVYPSEKSSGSGDDVDQDASP